MLPGDENYAADIGEDMGYSIDMSLISSTYYNIQIMDTSHLCFVTCIVNNHSYDYVLPRYPLISKEKNSRDRGRVYCL